MAKHSSTDYTPYYLVFGQHPIQHGSKYSLLQKPQTLPLTDVEVLPPAEFRDLINSTDINNLAHDHHKKVYNTRIRQGYYVPGQKLFRRSFQQSDFVKGFNAKLGRQWVAARVVKKIGTALYELEDRDGKRLSMTMLRTKGSSGTKLSTR